MKKEIVLKKDTLEDKVMLPHRLLYALEEVNYELGLEDSTSLKITIETI